MKYLLPQDTLAIDVITFGNLILMTVCAAFYLTPFPSIDLTQFFWLTLLGSFSILSGISIWLNRMTPLRVLLQWILGMLFTYIAISKIGTTFESSDIAVLSLGISNLYACIININLLLEDFRDGQDCRTHS